jgi:predicted dehydrogenase
MKVIKIALVGAGYMSLEHARAFSGLPGVSLVGITSRTRVKAEQLAAIYAGIKVFDSIEEMFGETRADLVIVSVKEMSMSLVALECFSYPWAVLLEKPAGYGLANALLILEAARQNRSRVWVALNRRAYSSTRQAKLRLDSKEGPRFIHVVDQQDQISAREKYGEPTEVVQNYMYANSIHLIDYFRVFGRGEVTRVTPICPWTPLAPWIVLAKVDFSSGDCGVYEGVWSGPGPWAVTVVTPDQRLEMRPLEQASLQVRGERMVTNLPIDPQDIDYKPGLRQQASEMLAALVGQPSLVPTLEDSFKSMQLVSDIFALTETK